MSHQFAIGDTVKIKRSGLAVEVVGFMEPNPAKVREVDSGANHTPEIDLVLCAWINEPDEYMEVYFNANDLQFVRVKQEAAEPVAESLVEPMPEKPLSRHRKRKAVESE